MEIERQLQVTVNTWRDRVTMRITSGITILVELNYGFNGRNIDETFIDSELMKAFSFALGTLRGETEKGGD